MIVLLVLIGLRLTRETVPECPFTFSNCSIINCTLSDCVMNIFLNETNIAGESALYNFTDVVMNITVNSSNSQLNQPNFNVSLQQVILKRVQFHIQWSDVKIVFKETFKHFLIYADSDITIIQSQLKFPHTVFIMSNGMLMLQNSEIKAQKLSTHSRNIVIDYSTLTSPLVECKGKCSCNTYGNCSTSAQSMYDSYISLADQLAETQKIEIANKIRHATIPKHKLSEPEKLMEELVKLNFTIAIIAIDSFISQNNGYIIGAYIGIYTTYFTLNNSLITSEGMGCDQSEGLGCGFLDWIIGLRLQCGGTGASHGGDGGLAISVSPNYLETCLQMKSRPIYDDPFNPIFEGSGGGAQSDNEKSLGKGGGVIYVEVVKESQFIGGEINSEGFSSLKDINFGSGSGGSIQFRTGTLIGNGTLIANGGGSLNDEYGNKHGGVTQESLKSYGGAGGGGRIRLHFYDQQLQQNKSLLDNVTLNCTHGYISEFVKNATKVYATSLVPYKGSIISSSCSQGYGFVQHTYTCQMCQGGTYQLLYGILQCRQCINYDPNAKYNNNDTNISMSPFCIPTGCKSGYHLTQKKQCLTQGMQFVESMGGTNGVFTFIVALILLVISMIVILVRKQQKPMREKFQSNSSLLLDEDGLVQQRDQSSATGHFVTQDLPYHVKRIYLAGNNSYSQPWQIYDDSAREFQLLDTPIHLQCLFEEFNQEASFPHYQVLILFLLQIYYYPFFLICQSSFRQSNYCRLLQFLENKKREALNSNQSGCYLKFSTSTDFTLGFIDILNYNQDVLAWSNMTQFPVSLVLAGQGTFMSPMNIYLKDPLIKMLWLSFKRIDAEIDDDEKSNLEEFVLRFNYYAKLIDFRQSCNSFIKHFVELVGFTNHYNKQVFSHQKIQVDVCVHLIATTNNEQNSKLIMLGLENYQDLEKCFSDIYHLQNFSHEYEIKLSINFDCLNSQKLFDDQIIIETKNNINRQIDEYKKYEDDRELLNNLKLKMKKRLEQGQSDDQDIISKQGSYAQSYQRFDNFSAFQQQRIQKTQESFYYSVKYFLLQLNKGLALIISHFTRYRSTKIENKVLVSLLCIVLLFEWGFAIVYPIILIDQTRKGSYNNLGMAELILECAIFPFSQIISPLLLSIWLINSSRIVGKYFLCFNYCGIISAFIEFLFGTTEMFMQLDYVGSESEQGRLLNLIKVFQFFVMLISSHLACLHLNYNEQLVLRST